MTTQQMTTQRMTTELSPVAQAQLDLDAMNAAEDRSRAALDAVTDHSAGAGIFRLA